MLDEAPDNAAFNEMGTAACAAAIKAAGDDATVRAWWERLFNAVIIGNADDESGVNNEDFDE